MLSLSNLANLDNSVDSDFGYSEIACVLVVVVRQRPMAALAIAQYMKRSASHDGMDEHSVQRLYDGALDLYHSPQNCSRHSDSTRSLVWVRRRGSSPAVAVLAVENTERAEFVFAGKFVVAVVAAAAVVQVATADRVVRRLSLRRLMWVGRAPVVQEFDSSSLYFR